MAIPTVVGNIEGRHYQALGNLDTLFRLATRDSERAGKKAGDVGRVQSIHHFVVPFPFDGRVLQARMMVKEFTSPEQGHRIYRVRALEIETPASNRGVSTVPDNQARHPLPPAGVSDEKLAPEAAHVKRGPVSGDDLGQMMAEEKAALPDFWSDRTRVMSREDAARALDAMGRPEDAEAMHSGEIQEFYDPSSRQAVLIPENMERVEHQLLESN